MRFTSKFFWLAFIQFVILLQFAESISRYTNVECKSLDEKFSVFKTCRLNVPKRSVIALNIHMHLLQLPVRNLSLHLSLFKKANGYRPFLSNLTTDFCAFMANRMRYPFLNIYLSFFVHASNLNHTCPYNHDVIVKNLVLHDDQFQRFPLPAGDYVYRFVLGAYNVWRAEIKTYFQVKLN